MPEHEDTVYPVYKTPVYRIFTLCDTARRRLPLIALEFLYASFQQRGKDLISRIPNATKSELLLDHLE